MRTSPTEEIETLLNLVRLEILILGETIIWAFKLRLNNEWKTSRGHGGIVQVIAKPILEIDNEHKIQHIPSIGFSKFL